MRYTAAFMRKAWWLALVPTIPKLVYALGQIHGVFPQQDDTQIDLWLLAVSTFLTVMTTYWVIRFLVLDQSVSAALSVNRKSISTFAPYAVVFYVFWIVVSLLANSGLSLGVVVLAWLLSLCFASLFAPWSVAAPSGSKSIGPIVSLRHGRKHLVWGACLLVVVQMPFDIAVQVLAGVDIAYDSNVWLQSVILASAALILSISSIAWNAAVLVIASRAGVRVNSSRGIEDIFA